MSERRQALKILGAIGATCAGPFAANDLYGQHADHNGEPLVQIQPSAAPKHLTAAEYRILSRLADLIIPATETPGALAAGVPQYIDQVAGGNAELRKLLADGCAWMESKKFLAMSEARQIRFLTPLCEAADKRRNQALETKFFAAVKNLTADGFFTSKAGLIDTLGYPGNAVLAAFPECSTSSR